MCDHALAVMTLSSLKRRKDICVQEIRTRTMRKRYLNMCFVLLLIMGGYGDGDCGGCVVLWVLQFAMELLEGR